MLFTSPKFEIEKNKLGELGEVKSQSAFYFSQVWNKLGELGEVKSKSAFYFSQVWNWKK